MGEHHKKVLQQYLRSHQSKSKTHDGEHSSSYRPNAGDSIDRTTTTLNEKFKWMKVSKTESSTSAPRNTALRKTLPRIPVARRKLKIDDLPDEILLIIFEFLPANDLLVSASVCRRWLKLSNDDILWQGLYIKYGQLKRNESVDVQLKCHGGIRWKRECIRRCIEKRNSRLKLLLKKINNYTLLPGETKKVIEKLGIKWQLVLTDSDKNEHIIDQSDVSHFLTSITVRWYSLEFPPIRNIRQVAIYAIAPVFFHKNGSPVVNSPCQRSLLLKSNPQTILKGQEIGGDDRVSLYYVQGGPLLAVWKEDGDLAFVSQSFHCSHLIQRCLHGSSESIHRPILKKPPVDDIDPQYGLHDYTCVVELRNQRAAHWNQQFTFLHTCKTKIVDGMAKLVLIREDKATDHSATSKKLSLPWKTEIFKGIIQNVCIMDVTLHDEFKEVMWTVSSPVVIAETEDHKVDFTYDGPEYHITYNDETGHVMLRLIWIEDRDIFLITKAELNLSCKAINQWFKTKY
ncbi:F-box only protein 15-like [Antedon mediterranea]|uniref:F-box only protein 15-like n=1 Tax=Antedon mediterranea TaxID=105859 RepID=UPI003AF9CA66